MVLYLLIRHTNYDDLKEVFIRKLISLCDKLELVLEFGVNGEIVLRSTSNDSEKERSESYQCLEKAIRNSRRSWDSYA